MVNLQVSSLSLSFGDRVILSDVSFSLSEKSRIALMGANGSGKSTLLKAISHNIEAESMNISLTKGARISYLPQSDIVPAKVRSSRRHQRMPYRGGDSGFI